MSKLIVTLVRNEAPREEIDIALAILTHDGDARDVNKSEGILRDDDGIVAVWEIVE